MVRRSRPSVVQTFQAEPEVVTVLFSRKVGGRAALIGCSSLPFYILPMTLPVYAYYTVLVHATVGCPASILARRSMPDTWARVLLVLNSVKRVGRTALY